MGKKKQHILTTRLVPWLTAILLCAASYTYLYEHNADMLFMAGLRSMFVNGWEFFAQCMQRPGGLLQWAGLWLTQLFYVPWIGVAALTVIWLLTFALLKRAFRVTDALSPLVAVPLVCLLVSVIDLGYWIYYIHMPGYIFRESLGFLSVALLLLAPGPSRSPRTGGCRRENTPPFLSAAASRGSSTNLGGAGGGFAAIIAALTYPLIGYYSVMALACMAIRNALNRKWTGFGIAALLLAVAPIMFRAYYSTMRTDETYTIGFPEFSCFGEQATELVYPFYVAIAALLLLATAPLVPPEICRRPSRSGSGEKRGDAAARTLPHSGELEGAWRAWGLWALSLTPLAIVTLCSVFTLNKADFDDDNFHAECKAYRAIDEQRWDDALRAISAVRGDVTRELIIFKNIALFNTGGIGDQMYSYKDIGVPPTVKPPLRVNLAELAAPLIYLHHGQTNYAYRWCMENNVVHGETITNLKVMALSAMVSGDYKVAKKYLHILSHTLYYKPWAEKYLTLLRNPDPKKIAMQPELKNICEAHANIPNETRSDNSLCEKFIIETYSTMTCPTSPYTSEMTMAYALISKDIARFWRNFAVYARLHQAQPMPRHYQEAAYLYGVLEPQTVNTSGMPFDKQTIVARFDTFWQTTQQLLATGMTTEAIGEATRSEYGDTFWWSYYFDRNSKYY